MKCWDQMEGSKRASHFICSGCSNISLLHQRGWMWLLVQVSTAYLWRLLLSSEQHIPQVCPRWSKLTASVDVVNNSRRLSKSTSSQSGPRCTCDAIASFHFLLLSMWAVVPSPTHSLGRFLHWHIYIAIEVLIKPFPRSHFCLLIFFCFE